MRGGIATGLRLMLRLLGVGPLSSRPSHRMILGSEEHLLTDLLIYEDLTSHRVYQCSCSHATASSRIN